MRLLILGGTVFLGRALVDAARERGHTVTLFNRGISNPTLYPDLEQVHGDRAHDLGLLEGRAWDAVIDTSGYLPRIVGENARALAASAAHYTFISTISVYAPLEPGSDESAGLAELTDPGSEDVQKHYGPLKTLCEVEVESTFPGRSLILRPGLIVGPHDPTDRFTYWPVRVSRGGEILAPGDPSRQVQVIDVRDLAEWNIRAVEDGATGTFNATGPDYRMSMADLLAACSPPGESRITWVDEDFLLANGAAPWSELPLWLPGAGGLLGVDVSRAISAGLTFRPLAATAADTLVWANTRPHAHEWRAGLPMEKEHDLLDLWHARASPPAAR